jgi:hypothetical protein
MSVSQDAGSSDLQIALAGGEQLRQRIEELTNARQSLMDAYTDLGIGQQAKIAYEEALALKASAEKAIVDGKAEADAAIITANARAETIIATANEVASKLKSDASEEARLVRDEAEGLRAGAKVDAENARVAIADANAKSKYANEIAAQAVENKKKAEDAASIYAAESEKLKALREKVYAALRIIDVPTVDKEAI